MGGEEAHSADPQSKLKETTKKVPPELVCPLSQRIMWDPVIIASGQTYDRSSIEQWLEEGNKTCPKTRQFLGHRKLTPNYSMKELIHNWCLDNEVPLPCLSGRRNSKGEPNKIVTANLSNDENNMSDITGDIDGSLIRFAPKCDSYARQSKTALQQRLTTSMVAPKHNAFSLRNFHYFMSQTSSSDTSSSGLSTRESFISSQASPCTASLNNFSDFCPYSTEISGELEKSENSSIAYSVGSKFRMDGEPKHIPDLDAHLEVYDHEDLSHLVRMLQSSSVSLQKEGAGKLRLLARKNSMERAAIAEAGAIEHLVNLLTSEDPGVKEVSVTALLNLSLNEDNKDRIGQSGAISFFVDILSSGTSEAKQNAAATLFSLSSKPEYKEIIGSSGAIPPLVDLLKSGTPRGKKDAAVALFNLSMVHENRRKIIRAGAVKPLICIAQEPRMGIVDQAVSLLASLSVTTEGKSAIGEEGGIPALIEVVEAGSQKGKENAAAALLKVCSCDKYRHMLLKDGATPVLYLLSKTGTARAKEKAVALLQLIRGGQGNTGHTH